MLGKLAEKAYWQHRIVQRRLVRWSGADVRIKQTEEPRQFMPKTEYWTFDRAVHAMEPVPEGVMLGAPIGRGGEFLPIASGAAVFGDKLGSERNLTDEIVAQLWKAWWSQEELVPLSTERVLAIRLAKLLAGF
jgi:hypothetical protein